MQRYNHVHTVLPVTDFVYVSACMLPVCLSVCACLLSVFICVCLWLPACLCVCTTCVRGVSVCVWTHVYLCVQVRVCVNDCAAPASVSFDLWSSSNGLLLLLPSTSLVFIRISKKKPEVLQHPSRSLVEWGEAGGFLAEVCAAAGFQRYANP